MSQYKDKKVAILGLSVEGIDSVKFFSREGAFVTCCDRRTKDELDSAYSSLLPLANNFQLGTNCLSGLDKFDLLVRTPGMSLRLPQFKNLQNKENRITSLTKLFFDHCRAPIIGVTGTKGKGTTSTLICEILRRSGKTVWLGGNVGTPLLSRVHEINPADIVVLELSSFQLEDVTRSPHIAVVLKTTQEHLANFDPLATNYHANREAYVEAKKSIVRYQKLGDFAIFNKDDVTSTSFAKETHATAYYFSRTSDTADAYVQNQTVYLTWDHTRNVICNAGEIKLIGTHNLENIAAATIASRLAGASLDSIRHTARLFKGLEHRLELVRTIGGVSYYNDSFSTIPETTIAALQSFTKPIILIVGGSDKGSDYQALGEEIAKSTVKCLIVIGAMTDRILSAVAKAGYRHTVISGLSTMNEVVRSSVQHAVKGDIVLLSPACASFGMFKNYKERGKLFKHEVFLL